MASGAERLEVGEMALGSDVWGFDFSNDSDKE